MDENIEITEKELLTHFKLYWDIIEKLYKIIDPIFDKDVDTIIDTISISPDDTEIYIYVTENYRGCSYNKSFYIPIYALKNKQIFNEWHTKGYVDEKKQHEENAIKIQQRQIEQEKKEYELLKAKYENND